MIVCAVKRSRGYMHECVCVCVGLVVCQMTNLLDW